MHVAYALRLLTRKFPWVMVAALIGLAFGALLTAQRTYTTSSILLVQPADEAVAVRAAEPARFVRTQTQKLLGESILATAAQTLNDGTSPLTLREAITLIGGTQSDILEVAAAGASSEQSAERARAFLDAALQADLDEISVQTLWTDAPRTSQSATTLLVGGATGGLFVGALGVLLWGAIRRPIEKPRSAIVGARGLIVFPVALDPADPQQGERAHEVVRLATSHADTPWRVYVDDLANSPASRAITEQLQAAAPPHVTFVDAVDDISDQPGARTAVIQLAAAGSTTERAVEDRSVILFGLADRAVLAIIEVRRPKRLFKV